MSPCAFETIPARAQSLFTSQRTIHIWCGGSPLSRLKCICLLLRGEWCDSRVWALALDSIGSDESKVVSIMQIEQLNPEISPGVTPIVWSSLTIEKSALQSSLNSGCLSYDIILFWFLAVFGTPSQETMTSKKWRHYIQPRKCWLILNNNSWLNMYSQCDQSILRGGSVFCLQHEKQTVITRSSNCTALILQLIFIQ